MCRKNEWLASLCRTVVFFHCTVSSVWTERCCCCWQPEIHLYLCLNRLVQPWLYRQTYPEFIIIVIITIGGGIIPVELEGETSYYFPARVITASFQAKARKFWSAWLLLEMFHGLVISCILFCVIMFSQSLLCSYWSLPPVWRGF